VTDAHRDDVIDRWLKRATTGVAGPDPQDGVAVGTVFVAVADAAAGWVREHALAGDRAAIRAAAVAAALRLLAQALAGRDQAGRAGSM